LASREVRLKPSEEMGSLIVVGADETRETMVRKRRTRKLRVFIVELDILQIKGGGDVLEGRLA
tara:strand:+ start:1665 stop:1853 length:189 start_codon:yes stop_codon:yes gene_type:complete